MLRFLTPLALILVALAVSTAFVVERTSDAWAVRDVDLRAELAVTGARSSLGPALRAHDLAGLNQTLNDFTRDRRLMAAVACDQRLQELARTELLPDRYGCDRLGTWATSSGLVSRVEQIGSARLHTKLIDVHDADGLAGWIAVVHDLTFADRRAAAGRWFVVAGLAALALLASGATFVYMRITRRRWTEDVRRAVRGDAEESREFRPLLADLRELSARLDESRTSDVEPRGWGPDRLRRTLAEHLAGERVLIVANREPYIHERTPDGGTKVIHPASGLVTALEPVLRACSGIWIAHGAGSADRETADARGRIRVPPGDERYTLRRVWMTKEEEEGYYYGFANEGLWPLCHVAHTRPSFRIADWEAYQTINRRFAEVAAEEAAQPDPIVLVQDYHFALAPALLRARLPRATICSFWHIPWPNCERLGICPQRRELLEGMLGASIIGFHTQGHCNNFLESVERYLEARIDREAQAVVFRGRTTLVRSYPISVEWPNRWAEAAPPAATCRAELLRELGLGDDALLGVGVDRLDYTKGIEERFLAVERLLERHPELVGRFTFVQLAAPSRATIPRYADLNGAIEALATRINARFAGRGGPPIVLLREHHEPARVYRTYRAADLCYVSSLHDGMNLVAKEFVAAREDERGVLVLSSFAGAARELTEALIVNPYDLEEASAALHRAIVMPANEQTARMRAMRDLVAEFNVFRWAGRMLVDAGRVRRRERWSPGA